jgi:hypothetical protein
VNAEISYDLVMEEDMNFVGGCYRLPGRVWEVFTIARGEVLEPEHRFCEWESGVPGVALRVPKGMRLNKDRVERLLATILRVDSWQETIGPDSIALR